MLKVVLFFSRLTSLAMLGVGVRGLFLQLLETYELYIAFQGNFDALTRNRELFISILLQQLVFKSLTNFISTAYGLMLLSKPSGVIKISQILTTIFLIGINIYINSKYPLPL